MKKEKTKCTNPMSPETHCDSNNCVCIIFVILICACLSHSIAYRAHYKKYFSGIHIELVPRTPTYTLTNLHKYPFS